MCSVEVRQLDCAQLWAHLGKYRPHAYTTDREALSTVALCWVFLKYFLSFIIHELWKYTTDYNGCNLRKETSRWGAEC